MASSFIRFPHHTERRITVGRTPLDEWSARRRDLYLTTHNIHNRQTSMPSTGFEPTISADEWPQTYALDRAATGTGAYEIMCEYKNMVRPDVPQMTIWYGPGTAAICMTHNYGDNTYTHFWHLLLAIVDSSTKYFVAWRECKGNPLLHLHGNTEHFLYCSQLHVYQRQKGGAVLLPPMAAVLKRTGQTVTLYCTRFVLFNVKIGSTQSNQ